MDPTIFAKDEYIENQDFGIQVKKEEYIMTKQEDSDPHAFLFSQNNTEASSEHIKRNYIETKVEYEDGQDKARNSCCKKPFKILRNLPSFNKRIDGKSQDFSIKNEFEEDGEEHHEIEKKIVRVSACKNYIGLLCAGFSRTLLNAEKSSPIIEILARIIDQRKMRFEACRIMLTEKIMELFKTYIYKSVCGKRVKKCNQERDFKIRNSHELDNILMIKQRDSEQTCLRKEVLKEMLVYFFDSDYYYEWLSKGMISEGNRIFFIKNKKEIQRKFLNPAFYKPKFNHNQEEEGRLSNKED